MWVERGVVYSIGSGTPKKVSLAQLRATAAGLDRLEREYIGTSSDPDSSSGAVAVTTQHTVTANVTLEAACTAPGATDLPPRGGEANVTLLPRRGNRFGFDIADFASAPWTGTAAGTISPTAITLDVRAMGTIEGQSCDTGRQSMTLDQRAI